VFKPVDKPSVKRPVVTLQPNDAWIEITHADGRTQKLEAYYGSTYLSQSTRSVSVPAGATAVAVTDYAGKRRTVVPKMEMASSMVSKPVTH
jgi:hypothetical protein